MRGHVRKKGNRWYYSFDIAGENGKRRKIERAGGSTRKEAEKALRSAINEYETAGTLMSETNMSVSDYLDYWYEDYVLNNLKTNTQLNYKGIIDNHLKELIGHYRLKHLNPKAVQKCIDAKFKEGLSKQTIAIIKTVLTGSMRRAVYPYQFIKQDPTRYITMPKYDERKQQTRKEMKILNVEQFQQLTKHVPKANPFYIPMMIAFYTGLRRSEVLGLEWKHISFKSETLTVEQIIVQNSKEWNIGTPKTQSSYRTIGIGAQLVAILKEHKKRQEENKEFYGNHYVENDFVCTKENGDLITPYSLKYWQDKASEESGIDFTFHSFRHTHATLLLENGAKEKAIQERLGHARIGTTMDTYSHLTKKTKKDTVNIFETLLQDDD